MIKTIVLDYYPNMPLKKFLSEFAKQVSEHGSDMLIFSRDTFVRLNEICSKYDFFDSFILERCDESYITNGNPPDPRAYFQFNFCKTQIGTHIFILDYLKIRNGNYSYIYYSPKTIEEVDDVYNITIT